MSTKQQNTDREYVIREKFVLKYNDYLTEIAEVENPDAWVASDTLWQIRR